MEKQIESNEAVNFLKNARDIAFFFTIFLYYMGWIYIYFYLDAFGLSNKAAEVSIYNLLIYSSNVFIYLYQQQKLLILTSIAVVLFVRLYAPITILINKLFFILIIAIFPVVFLISKCAAEHNANYILNNPLKLKTIIFTFKDIKMDSVSIKKNADSVIIDNNNERLRVLSHNKNSSFRLLSENNDQYFVMLKTTHSSPNSPNIFFIDKKNVEFAFITK